MKVVKSTLTFASAPLESNCLARKRARWMAVTVFPVPAPPVTRNGPFHPSWVASLRCSGCSHTRHLAKSPSRTAWSSFLSSPSTAVKLNLDNGLLSAVSRSLTSIGPGSSMTRSFPHVLWVFAVRQIEHCVAL